MKRGEVYYIQHRHTVGSEVAKGRPAIIVSNDALNATSDVIEVVFLTTKPKKELPTHVTINATGIPSTALCEQVNSVSKALVGDYFGRCSVEEMREINSALRRSLDVSAIAHIYEGVKSGKLRVPRRNDNIALLPYYVEAAALADANEPKPDPVNHPSHYTDGKIEVIDYIEDKGLGYHLGNAVKYISRAGKKDPAKYIEDLKKAVWYLNREIAVNTKEAEG